MRWVYDELDDTEQKPYREGNVYICRNCAAELKKPHVLCYDCRKRRARLEYLDRQNERPMED